MSITTAVAHLATKIDLARLVVVTDLDNTVQKYNAQLARREFEATGRRVPESCPDYSFVVSQWFDTTEAFLNAHVREVRNGMFATMDAYDGAREVLSALRAHGATVKVATYRFIAGDEGLVRETTIAGLARNGIEYDELHFVRNKYEVPGDVYIDDAPYVIEALDERGLDRIVFDQEYNRHFTGPRARSWVQVPTLLGSIMSARLVVA